MKVGEIVKVVKTQKTWAGKVALKAGEEVRVQSLAKDGWVWVSNVNQPFMGSFSNWVPVEDVEEITFGQDEPETV